MADFLADYAPERPAQSLPAGLAMRGVYLTRGNATLEIMVLEATSEPSPASLLRVWKERSRRCAPPMIVVALHGDRASVCGPAGEDRPIRRMEITQAERVCRQALAKPNRQAALRYLEEALPAASTDLPGIRNEGLLSNHELTIGAGLRDDWAAAQANALPILGATGLDLLRRLGFGIERADNGTTLLNLGTRDRTVAVLLDAGEIPEGAVPRSQNLSPISWALNEAAQRNLPWVLVVQDDRIRLYPAESGVGVGRRGRTETWIELRCGLMRQQQAGLLWLIVSADALKAGGTLSEMLESSKRFAADLAVRLRERIYGRVVPLLAKGIVAARGLRTHTAEDLRLTYAMALTILFRLLFIAYAEDRDLLPFASRAAYRNRSLKQRAQELFETNARPGPGSGRWQEVCTLFEAVRVGDPALGVPAYGGGLFETDPAISPAGAALAGIILPDTVFEPALRALLLDETRDLGSPGAGPVDFRSLRVGEFGTIYEGLLESELALADTDLALKKQGKDYVYIPARATDSVEVPEGGIYLHNRSGARKSSGSYYTPGFVVDHLLQAALKPALEAHANRLTELDETGASEAFFDIRIADIAMGSGHFLVAAIDMVEQALTAILADRKLPGVTSELAKLRHVAESELERLGLQDTLHIDDSQLLRRLIARRCIYGIDLNPLAVDLARLSIWIHTFVPALPLSLLDHSLVAGNSLVGIATVAQIEERFAAAGMALFPVNARSLLGEAAEPLKRLAKLADATLAEIEVGRKAMEHAQLAVEPTRALCDLIIAEKVAPTRVMFQYENWLKERAGIKEKVVVGLARSVLEGLNALHFPAMFPEVFLRQCRGFDVILGNPPWQEVTVEAHAFWARHFPGLRGLPAREREAKLLSLPLERPDLHAEYLVELSEVRRERVVLGAGFFPGMNTGELDLYKAFVWRFWQLAAEQGGHIGVVLPRSALSALGSKEVRQAIFSGSAWVDIVSLSNRAGWVFMEAEHRYTMILLSARRGKATGKTIALRGPFDGRASWDEEAAQLPHRFAWEEVSGWTSSASLPLLPSDRSIGVFTQIRAAPRLDLWQQGGWRARPVRELHATDDKPRMKFLAERPSGFIPVYKGESFDIWDPDRGGGSYYAWCKPDAIALHLQLRRLRSSMRSAESPFDGFSLEHLSDFRTLPHFRPRIAIRDVTNRTNTRTICVALIPPNVLLSNQANYFLWPSGDEMDEAFLLGVLSSVPADWYARRFVETHLSLFIVNSLPIPRPLRSCKYWRRVVALAGRLACPDDRFTAWAQSVGVACGPLDPAEKCQMIEELDAVVARLYGLTDDQLVHIFDTFHEWPDAQQARAWAARRDRTVALLRGLG